MSYNPTSPLSLHSCLKISHLIFGFLLVEILNRADKIFVFNILIDPVQVLLGRVMVRIVDDGKTLIYVFGDELVVLGGWTFLLGEQTGHKSEQQASQ